MTLDQEDIAAIAAEVVRRLDVRAIARELHRMTHEMGEARMDAEYLASLGQEESHRILKQRFAIASAEMRARMKVDPVFRKQMMDYREDQQRQKEARRVQREAERAERKAKAEQKR